MVSHYGKVMCFIQVVMEYLKFCSMLYHTGSVWVGRNFQLPFPILKLCEGILKLIPPIYDCTMLNIRLTVLTRLILDTY